MRHRDDTRKDSAEKAVRDIRRATRRRFAAEEKINLGLRDAWDLAELCCRSADPGAQDTLSAFAALRRFDLRATVGVTDALLRAFGGTHPLLRAGRCVALTALDLLPPARKFFARRMIFGPSAIP